MRGGGGEDMKYFITEQQLERLKRVHLFLAREIMGQKIQEEETKNGYDFVCSHCKGKVATTDKISFDRKLCISCEKLANTYV